jgi:exodeoxyribonuclease VII large subunit
MEPAQGLAPRAPWGVSALLLATGDALAARFGAVSVRGEISGFSRAASGHCYFTLKDAAGAPGVLRCAMFRRAASLLDVAPGDGQQVDVRGRLGVYEARGELQMVVESLQRVGAGSLFEEFLRLRARLEAAGLFDAARKRALPVFPRAIGVITSLQAAALRDVLTTLRRRAPHVRVFVYPSPVQGADAPQALVAALELAGCRAEVDTLLLVRGGGSLEDLWAFNDERVVRAVAACPLPLVCGVGHETDFSLSDLAADLRAATPTAAAELAAPAREELLAQLQTRQAALRRSLLRAVQQQAQRVDMLALRMGQPGRALWGQAERLQALQRRLQLALAQRQARHADELPLRAERLRRALRLQVQREQMRLAAVHERLQALDPQQVLRRGYAWIEAADGRPVLSTRQLQPGQMVRAVWADGAAGAQITAVESLPAEQ